LAAVIERTLRSTPADATHWSIRSMAAAVGFSHTTIRRIWTAFGLQPHRAQTFKLLSDPLFVDKVRDIVGLYLSPPNRAAVPVAAHSGHKAIRHGMVEKGRRPSKASAVKRTGSPPAYLS